MGRSKFPGKPSKHGNRTRVNVLATNSATGPAPAGIASATAAAAAAAAGGAVSTNGNATNRATAAASDNNPSVVAVGVDDELDEDEERQVSAVYVNFIILVQVVYKYAVRNWTPRASTAGGRTWNVPDHRQPRRAQLAFV